MACSAFALHNTFSFLQVLLLFGVFACVQHMYGRHSSLRRTSSDLNRASANGRYPGGDDTEGDRARDTECVSKQRHGRLLRLKHVVVSALTASAKRNSKFRIFKLFSRRRSAAHKGPRRRPHPQSQPQIMLAAGFEKTSSTHQDRRFGPSVTTARA